MAYETECLTLEQTADIYTEWIDRHFPQDEIKPFASIRRMWEAGCYQALGLYRQNADGTRAFAGYAFFVLKKGGDLLLLDYLAIVEEYRGSGAGSSFLKEMKRQFSDYKGILIETEDIDYACSDEQRMVRRKRDAFYARNGALKTGIRGCVYGVHYAIWMLPAAEPVPEVSVKENLEDIYRIIIPGEKYTRHVEIF